MFLRILYVCVRPVFWNRLHVPSGWRASRPDAAGPAGSSSKAAAGATAHLQHSSPPGLLGGPPRCRTLFQVCESGNPEQGAAAHRPAHGHRTQTARRLLCTWVGYQPRSARLTAGTSKPDLQVHCCSPNQVCPMRQAPWRRACRPCRCTVQCRPCTRPAPLPHAPISPRQPERLVDCLQPADAPGSREEGICFGPHDASAF